MQGTDPRPTGTHVDCCQAAIAVGSDVIAYLLGPANVIGSPIFNAVALLAACAST